MSKLEAVILAGGRSSRMGRDKALLPFGGYTSLAEYQYRSLLPLFARVSISAKSDKFPFDAPLILDQGEESSPMVALASILRAVESEGVFLLGVDMPFVTDEVVRKILRAFEEEPDSQVYVAQNPRGTEPLCAIYRKDLLPRAEELLHKGRHRLQDLLERSLVCRVDFDNAEAFVNLNTPQEYDAAQG